MQNPSPTIDALMKIHLTIKTGAANGSDSAGTPFKFIYGVGTDGITPFEKALFGKSIGDRIELEIPASEHCTILGHLELPLVEQTGIQAPRSLQMTVTDVARADDREVVKAMASGGSCGDCGCGCGAH